MKSLPQNSTPSWSEIRKALVVTGLVVLLAEVSHNFTLTRFALRVLSNKNRSSN